MASLLLSVPTFTIRSTAQCREASERRLRQQFGGRVSGQFSKLTGASAARVTLPSSRSTSTVRAIGLRRSGTPGCSTITFRAPLRSRRYLETCESKLRMVEDETSYKLIAALPGVAADGITLNVTDDGLLKVDAKSKTDGREMLNRTLRLASDADLTKVDAVCADGILEVTISKVQPPEPISVPVSASEPPATDELYAIQKKVPGVAASEVKVSLEALRVERSTQSYQLVIHATSAKGYGEYRFTQTLPEDIIPEDATAFCCNGLLHVRIPRREPVRATVPVANVDEACAEEEQLQLAQFKVPGYSADQLFLWAMPGFLRVKFQRDAKGVAGRPDEVVVLPDEVDVSSIRAVCVDGVLTVKIPKSALPQTETRQVVVSAERA